MGLSLDQRQSHLIQRRALIIRQWQCCRLVHDYRRVDNIRGELPVDDLPPEYPAYALDRVLHHFERWLASAVERQPTAQQTEWHRWRLY
jgi:DNA-binding transcriptional regulator PaaX